MNEFPVAITFVTQFVFLFIGLRTKSIVAHLFSSMLGVALIQYLLSEGSLPILLTWVNLILSIYPIIQIAALFEKRKEGKKNDKPDH